MDTDERRPAVQFFYDAHVTHCHVVVPLAMSNGAFVLEESLTSPEFEDKLKALIEETGYLPKVLAACRARQKKTDKPTSISYHLLLG